MKCGKGTARLLQIERERHIVACFFLINKSSFGDNLWKPSAIQELSKSTGIIHFIEARLGERSKEKRSTMVARNILYVTFLNFFETFVFRLYGGCHFY